MTTATQGYWVRSGTCDQCASGSVRGECCTKLAFPISSQAGENPDIIHFFGLHGVKVHRTREGMAVAVVPVRCSALLPNGDCSLYGLPERPEVCNSGPLNAWAGEINLSCSYKFEWDGEKES